MNAPIRSDRLPLHRPAPEPDRLATGLLWAAPLALLLWALILGALFLLFR